MAEKVTIMVLKVVDLQCSCCYKKIKKILCKFPQIRDQVYDEKANTVTITVVCCDPEKIRDKLCCKGAKVIKSIAIKEPPKTTEPEKPKVLVPEKPKEPVKPKEPEKPIVVVEKPKEPEKPKVVVVEKPKEPEKPQVEVAVEKPIPSVPPPVEKPKEAPKPDPPKIPQPVPNPPMEPEPVMFQGMPPLYPVPTCCDQCYGGYDGGPCRLGYGVPPPPLPRFEGYYGYGCGHGCGYGYGRDCHRFSRCDHYLNEENPSSCSIM
ncbi:uncharacterized protein [Primulina huaijiensis]|uniref:uncharacterized protein n=1 Tax=Primulina huaijiensis TaxID=1492673 RepID=UPI003CC71134